MTESHSNTRLLTRAMLGRSVIAAFIVGGLAFGINHDPARLARRWDRAMWQQLGLSMIVPFVVSLASAVLTRREMLADRSGAPAPPTFDASSRR